MFWFEGRRGAGPVTDRHYVLRRKISPSSQLRIRPLWRRTMVFAGGVLLLLVGIGLIVFLPGKYESLMVVIGLGLLFLLPVLDFLLLLIPNAAVLLFPSWIQIGKDSPRGIEAMGQRIIFAVGQLLVLLVALIPAALAFCAVFFPLKWMIGPIAPVLFAALAAALVLAVEAGFGVLLLGKLFERFDVAEEPAS